MPADRCLQRLAWAKQSPRQRPCAVEGLPGPLPQQDLQRAVADLEHDGERLMAGRCAAAGLIHRLSTYNRKLSGPVARPPRRPHAHGSDPPMPPLPPSATRRLDVEEVLGAAGFTPFHRKAMAITGIAWTFVAMEILLIGFTLPLFGSLWGLSSTWLGWIGASALAGSLVGSLA